jgi:uncharacterized membrane protein required for colicin V production
MIIFDIVLVLFLAGFVFYGLFFGLIRTIGSLLGLIIGVWAAAMFYQDVYGWVRDLAFGFDVLGKTIIFLIIFTLVNRLVVLIVAIINRTFDIISIIPFLKTINRLTGAIFGLIEGAFLLGFLYYFVQSFAILNNFVMGFAKGSVIMPYLARFVEVLSPIMPQLLDQLKNLV